MEVELVSLFVIFSADFNHIVEVSFNISLEGYVHLDCKPCSDGSLHIVVAFELVGLGLREFYSPDLLGDVADGYCNFVILMALDIYQYIYEKHSKP